MRQKIKRATIEDADKLRMMVLKSMDLANNKFVSDEQISAMKGYWSVENTKKYITTSGWNVFLAIENDEVKGTISFDTKEGVIFSPFIKNSKYFFDGDLGRHLLEFVEKFAKNNKHNKVSLISLPITKDFFLNFGYEVVEDLDLEFDGVKFPEFRLEKELISKNKNF
mgnify:CR=1 FL=1